MDTLKKYQVKFEVNKFFNKEFKQLNTINDTLSLYITDHSDIQQTDALLNEINAILCGTKTSGGWDTQGLLVATITVSQTKLYDDFETWADNNDIVPNYALPTSDFKAIVEAWRNYLLLE